MDYKKAYEQLQTENNSLKRKLKLFEDSASVQNYNLGSAYFQTIVQHLNTSTQADYTFVGKLIDNNTIETVSFYGKDKILENFKYELTNTPCKDVVGNSVCHYTEGITTLFPKDVLLQQMGIEGYIGVPLFDSKQNACGILVSLYKHAIKEVTTAESLLLLFASHAGAELEHERIYKKLEKSKKELKINNQKLTAIEEELILTNSQLFSANEFLTNSEQSSTIQSNRLAVLMNNIPDALLLESREGKIQRVNQKFCDLFNLKVPPAAISGAHHKQLIEQSKQLFKEGDAFVLRTETITHKANKVINEEIALKDGRLFERDFLPIELGEGQLEKLWLYRDVTERKKALLALQESKERFELAMHAASDGIFDLNIKTNEVYYSPGWKYMLGYNDNELKNDISVWGELAPAEDVKRTWGIINKHIADKTKRFESEFKMRHKDGHWVNILSRGNAILDENGEAVRIVGTHVDITERKKAEQEILHERNRSNYILEGTNAGTWDWDIQTGKLTTNQRWAEILGYTLEELQPTTVDTWINSLHPEDLKKSDILLQKHFNKELDYFSVEFRQKHKNGHWVWVSARGKVIEWTDDGKPHRMYGTHLDISGRKKAEKVLLESERKLKSLIESTNLIAWEVDTENQEFTYMSPAILKLTGYTNTEWNNFNFWVNLIHPEDRNEAVNYCNTKIEQGLDHNFEYRIVTKHGNVKWVKDFVFIVSENNKTYLRGFFLDNTDAKLAELKLQENEKKYRQLFENMTSGFALHEIICDKSGNPVDYRYIDVNPSFEKYTGIKRDNIIGKTVKQVMPNTEDYWIENFGKVALSGKSITVENYAQEIDKYFNVYAFSPAKNQFATIFSDITQRKKAEEALKESELRLKQLADLSFEGILIHEKGIAIDANDAFLRLTGYKLDEIIGKNLIELVVHESYKQTVYERTELENTPPTEFEIISKQGKTIPVEVNSRLINKEKLIKVASFQDITERKHIRQNLLNTRMKAEEGERERYAKELHDGLGPILSTCKVYFKTIDAIKEQQKRERHISRANELLEDALRSVKEISNNLSPHILRNYGITEAIRSFIEKLKDITTIQFEIKSNFSQRFSELIEFTLYRTLVELINNSIKHANAKTIKLSLILDDSQIKITYSDNGVGFNYEETKKSGKGFGLLNLEQRMKDIGGDYKFLSTPKKGTKVSININVNKGND